MVDGDSDGVPRRLQCEAEGHPLPQIVWLLPSRKMKDNQGLSSQSGPYQVSSSVPYPEEEGEELTCRAENEVGGAERTYPPRSSVVTSLLVCGAVVLLVSAGLTVACCRHTGDHQSIL